MPIVPFDALPDSARVWVFASDQPLDGAVADTLLAAVDQFLSEWKAHGVPLRCARDWRDGRFLAVGVDVTAENASGCSIDGLFRTLQQLEREIGARLVGGGRVFYRDAAGDRDGDARGVRRARASRAKWRARRRCSNEPHAAPADWRTRFEQPAGEGVDWQLSHGVS